MPYPLTSPSAPLTGASDEVSNTQAAAGTSPHIPRRLPVAPRYSVFDQARAFARAEGWVWSEEGVIAAWADWPILVLATELTDALASRMQRTLLPECRGGALAPAALQGLLRSTDQALGVLDHHLAGCPFVAGSAPQVVDALWTAFLARLKLLGLNEMCCDGRNPHVDRFYAAMKVRPGFAAAPVIETPSSLHLAMILLMDRATRAQRIQ